MLPEDLSRSSGGRAGTAAVGGGSILGLGTTAGRRSSEGLWEEDLSV